MRPINQTFERVGQLIASWITRKKEENDQIALDHALHAAILKPCDVVLVSSCDKASAAIKYVTQSTWSHAALYVGPLPGKHDENGDLHTLIEVNLGEGCVSSPLSKYANTSMRVCRPVGMSREDKRKVMDFMIARIGVKYDMKNIYDLGRYLLPTPPIPARWRRQALAMGSGDPTRAICSSMIASAFQSVRYPILPKVEHVSGKKNSQELLYHLRHNSLFVPADFDISPYFEVVKPLLQNDFDFKSVNWSEESFSEIEESAAKRPVASPSSPKSG